MSLEAARARRLVEARLGRPPQDALEAAVVLEAWAGVPAQRALETARLMMPKQAAEPAESATVPATPERPPGLLLEGTAFIVTVCAIALWAEPLTEALGVNAVRRALGLALPLTLALQWALLCRHLGRPSGLAGLAHRRGALVMAAVGLLAVPFALFGAAGVLAGLLTVTWTSGSIVIRRGWAALYCGVAVASVPVMLAGAPAPAVVAVVAAIIAGAAALALTTAGDGAAIPGRWGRTLSAAATGGGIGILLVGDPSVGWTASAAAALALLPSAAGALWAGQHLWKLPDAFARSLAGVPVCEAVDGPAPVGPLFAALWRLVLPTVVGSLALLALGSGNAGVLAGFGVVALATLLVGLLESFGRPGVAAAGIAFGLTAELLVREADTTFAGAALLCGGAFAVLVLLPAVFTLLAQPARTLATTLWIP